MGGSHTGQHERVPVLFFFFTNGLTAFSGMVDTRVAGPPLSGEDIKVTRGCYYLIM